MSCQSLIGRDATVFTVQSAGTDVANSCTFTYGTLESFHSQWKDIEVEISTDWITVTPSSANWQRRRRGVNDWSAKLNGLVNHSNSATFLELARAYDYVAVVFTEAVGGKTISIVGGIQRGGYSAGSNESNQSMDIVCVGFDDNPMFTYQ